MSPCSWMGPCCHSCLQGMLTASNDLCVCNQSHVMMSSQYKNTVLGSLCASLCLSTALGWLQVPFPLFCLQARWLAAVYAAMGTNTIANEGVGSGTNAIAGSQESAALSLPSLLPSLAERKRWLTEHEASLPHPRAYHFMGCVCARAKNTTTTSFVL
jgi:hypothetical protein